MIKLIECPRDAMQGIHEFIPTELKTNYLNQLLQVGFDTLDFGSFVSPKAIPQLQDTAQVLQNLDLANTQTKLLAIIANKRGAEDACQFEEISYLGYPFSVSETFQLRNTNATLSQSLSRVEEIQNLAEKHNKTMVVYLSMAFGNPYGESWHPDLVTQWAEKLHQELGIKILALSDTIGVSNPENITHLFTTLIPELPQVEFGAHLHTTPHTWEEKIKASVESGCTRFDGAIKGFGGCPMAADKLTGNMPTENMVHYFESINKTLGINKEAFVKATAQADRIFLNYH